MQTKRALTFLFVFGILGLVCCKARRDDVRKLMKHCAVIACAALFTFSLGACQSVQDNPKQTMGTVLGAGLGGLLGSQFGSGDGRLVATGLGVLFGAVLGSEIGRSLDNADKAMMAQAQQNALEYNRMHQTTPWRNPDTGNSGSYTPRQTYPLADGRVCREFETTVTIRGRTERAVGNACRGEDGVWRITSR